MKHFVGDIGKHERRGKRETADRIRDADSDGRDDGHEQQSGECFSYCWREVVAFGVMLRVLFVERCGTPNSTAVGHPAVNDVFAQAPCQEPEQHGADRCDHDGIVAELSMSFRAQHITRHRDMQAEIGPF